MAKLMENLKLQSKSTSWRIMVAIGGLAVGAVGWSIWHANHPTIAVDRITKVPEVDSTVGGKEQMNSPYYQKALETADKQHAEEAAKTGGSAIPTMGVGFKQAAVEADPVQQPQQQQPDPRQQQLHQVEVQRQQAAIAESSQALLTAKLKEAEGLMESWTKKSKPDVISVASASLLKGASDGTSKAAADLTEKVSGGKQTGPVIYTMGAIVPGRNVLPINSDEPGTPVMVEIVDGKLRGAKLSGVSSINKEASGFVLKLNKMVFNGEDYTVDAVVIDPDTDAATIADSYDPRYVERYGLMLGAKFLSGMATAMASAGQTAVVSGAGAVTVATPAASTKQAMMAGLGQFGTQVSADVGEAAPKGPLVKMYANSGIGIMFLSSVHELVK